MLTNSTRPILYRQIINNQTTILKYSFGRGSQKEHSVYAFDNVDNSG